MDKTGKFLLPSPKFQKLDKTFAPTPHFLSPQGMLLPKQKQPPPMYGPRGATVPPQFLGRQSEQPQQNASNQFERAQKYYCDSCEAEFHTSTDFKVHRSEHVQCEIENCSFKGHPSFMDTHIGLQHATGLYNQLKKLSTPEEIAEWRAQRKSNYPTVARVTQKQKAREQRMLRGERLEKNKNRFGKREDRRQMRGDQHGKAVVGESKPESKKRLRKKVRAPKEAPREVKDKPEVDEELTCHGVKMFKGTGAMVDYRKVKKVEAHALSSLLGMYGSGSEDESDSDVEADQHSAPEVVDHPIQEKTLVAQASHTCVEEAITQIAQATDHANEMITKSTSTSEDVSEKPQEPMKNNETAISDKEAPNVAPTAKDPNVPDRETLTSDDGAPDEAPIAKDSNLPDKETLASDDEAPDEAPIAKGSNVPDRPQSEIPRKRAKLDAPKRKTLKSGLDYRKLRTRNQNTMLEKLLEPDIRHERNVLLQCVRFVVENNFFGIGSSSSQP